MTRRNKKIISVKKNNLISIIVIFIMIYLIAIFIIYISKEKIKIYEVTQGSLSQNNTYTGLIIRDDKTVNSEYSGYVKCYLQNGEKARKGKAVYGIDETGETLQVDNSNGLHTSNISAENLNRLNKYLNNFKYNYDNQNFDSLYNFKYQMQSTLNDLAINALEEETTSDTADNNLKVLKANQSGLVIFKYDGYESLKESNIKKEIFDNTKVSDVYISTGELVQQGDIIYTMVQDQNWSIVIPIDETFVDTYADKSIVTIHLKTLDISVNVPLQIFEGADGGQYAKFSMSDYLAAYIEDRFINIEIEGTEITGFKIPKSSVVSKEFFVIPTDYVTTDSVTKEKCVTVKNASEDGTSSASVFPSIYAQDSKYYYVDDEILKNGDQVLIDGKEEYTIGEKKPLQGVYNVNKGYAVFEEIEIVDENEEYYIVRSNSTYGIVTFDHIVLNAATMKEDDLLY